MLRILDPGGNIIDRENFDALGLTAADCIKIYEYMMLTRLFAKRAVYEAQILDHMPLYISPKGQEAAEVSSSYALGPEDWIFWYTRSQGAPFTLGVSIETMWKLFYGIPDPEAIRNFLNKRVMVPYVLVGIHLTHAVGFAWAKLLEHGEPRVVTTAYFGDGATSRPDFHSAMNFASIHKIPTIFICENNQWAISTPPKLQTATKTFAEKAAAYSIPAKCVDGNDLFAVYAAMKEALQRARSGLGPTFIEAITYRLDPHTTAVGEIIKIPEEMKSRAEEEDPLKRTFRFMISDAAKSIGIDWSPEKDAARQNEIESLIKGVAKKTYPLLDDVNGQAVIQKTVELHARPKTGEHYRDLSGISFSPEIIPNSTPRDALNFGHYDVMTHDSSVIVIGEDIGRAGSVYRTVALPKKFVEEHLPEHKDGILVQHLPLAAIFGNKRTIDAPLDEWGIMGQAIGLALGGFRPVVEQQFSGFVFGAGDHIFVELARFIHRSAGILSMPVVVRLPYGAGRFIESHREFEVPQFLNLPGLTIVCPSTVQDFYDLFWAAAASDKPVLFFEDKNLYRGEFTLEYRLADEEEIKKKVSIKSDLVRRPPSKPIEEFGIGIRRKGTDATITAYGRLVYYCLEAAEILAQENISVEILDLRVFAPLDKETLINSVYKTGCLITVQEEPVFGGSGGEIAAAVYEAEKSFGQLRTPLVRLGPPRTYHPAHPFFRCYEPSPERIIAAVREVMQKKI